MNGVHLNKKKGVKGLFFGIVIMILIGSIAPAISGLETGFKQRALPNNDDFNKKIEGYMEKGCMPSLVACIIKDNATVWKNAYGYRDYYEEIESTNDTVYPVASVSKSFTATAIMQLNESGLLGLDDNVSESLGFDLKNPNYPEVNITFRMLLAHDSSLSDVIFSYTFLFYVLQFKHKKIDEFLLPGGAVYNPGVWNTFMPGTCSWYATINTEILTYIVTLITQQSFEEYCKENIFIPLKMYNTSFLSSNFEDHQLAKCYRYFFGFYIPMPRLDLSLGGGGLKTTISDFSHYLAMHTGRGIYDGVRILSEESVDEMHSVQYPGHYDEGYLHGLGWYMNETHGGHGGNAVGGRAEMVMRYSDRAAVAYFWNQNSFMLLHLNSTPEEQKNASKNIQNTLFKKADEF